mgnify:CR=1 FL=1
MKLFLIRHGDAIKTEKDTILTEKGIIQAKGVAKVLSSFDDQLFKLQAGSDESEVRVVQFQKNG